MQGILSSGLISVLVWTRYFSVFMGSRGRGHMFIFPFHSFSEFFESETGVGFFCLFSLN